MTLVNQHVIRFINLFRLLSASQYGSDLVAALSKILNRSLDNDLASSLALDAVVWLCKSHTVNIVSTWEVLRGVFESKLKTRTTRRLIPLFKTIELKYLTVSLYAYIVYASSSEKFHY